MKIKWTEYANGGLSAHGDGWKATVSPGYLGRWDAIVRMKSGEAFGFEASSLDDTKAAVERLLADREELAELRNTISYLRIALAARAQSRREVVTKAGHENTQKEYLDACRDHGIDCRRVEALLAMIAKVAPETILETETK